MERNRNAALLDKTPKKKGIVFRVLKNGIGAFLMIPQTDDNNNERQKKKRKASRANRRRNFFLSFFVLFDRRPTNNQHARTSSSSSHHHARENRQNAPPPQKSTSRPPPLSLSLFFSFLFFLRGRAKATRARVVERGGGRWTSTKRDKGVSRKRY